VRWASDLEIAEPGPLQTVRVHASWARGTLAVEGGLEGLKAMVLDRIITHSGDLRRDLSADRIAVRRGRVAGVRMEGQEEITGCNFVVFGADAHHLPRMIDVAELGQSFVERLHEVQPAAMRYTLNAVVDSAVLPEGMASNVLFIPDPDADLSGDNLLRIEVTGAPGQATRTLCVGALLPVGQATDLAAVEGMRERVLDRLRWLVPFLDRHLVAVDSPHDGRQLQDVRGGREVVVKDKWARHPGRMPTVSQVDAPGALDVTGLPHRTGLKNLVLACRQVVPGLGLEGEFITAWGAASIITRSDRRRLRFRKQSWTKIDL
jgi:phytoene dehydrogenase-like protein